MTSRDQSGERGRDALRELAGLLRAEQGLLAPLVAEPGDAELGRLIAAGPRTAANPEQYALVIESVREGHLLHDGRSRLLPAADRDLALLAGDYLYALGLERLAAVGDLAAIAELSDLISLSAQLLDAGADREELDWLWLASTVALAAGPTPEHASVMRDLRAGGPAGELARGSAERLAAGAGLSSALGEVAEAIHFAQRMSGGPAEA